jgi:acetyltransferase-like isoleucine patch superfamily enzyme
MDGREGWRRVPAVHGNRPLEPDPAYEVGLAQHLGESLTPAERIALYDRFADGHTPFDGTMRRVLVRALAKGCGDGLRVAPRVAFRHLETLAFGRGVFLGEGAFVQGRFDGRGEIGDRVWIGPHCVVDARDLVLEAEVGLSPGVRVIGSVHEARGHAAHLARDILIGPVRIGAGASVGAGAIVMPGVTIGARASIGAGAVVIADVPAEAVAVGVPARVVGSCGPLAADDSDGD